MNAKFRILRDRDGSYDIQRRVLGLFWFTLSVGVLTFDEAERYVLLCRTPTGVVIKEYE